MQRSNEWFFPAGSLARGGWQTVVDDGIPGWRHTGLRVGSLEDGAQLELPAGEVERIVVPLAGEVHVALVGAEGGSRHEHLAGRADVFDGPTDTLYLGVGDAAVLSGTGRVAVAEAPTSDRRPTCRIERDDVPVELRGAGASSRQVHNFGTPQALDAAKLIVCEVITPAENWSSYPAHKHDEHVPGVESELEEIYYFEAAVARGAEAMAAAQPFGLFSTYSSQAGEIDTSAMVRSGDVALVPFGYHGPAAAAPGYDLYYLNVMAGPGAERVWNITDDPAHAWVRAEWQGQRIDERLPYTRSN
ncbi:5-deoxy-glucuronate isomerase [Humibacter ginsenosidimutans]|uniref:5-deoxy-glucuronate isomerase n=1 Tax=Humibacter ginsenosidimutans TaxID=2599293 RepID=A0A5B8M975_9MICO|nr:5-deoxy-glucuronate isomerase [Humibacter ginsenosidimutans]QDZ16175.1 5-deoxy-glucuronate isomerase [Humibacter ginsenosidimutans]